MRKVKGSEGNVSGLLPFPNRGGARKGAGRKRLGERKRVDHRSRHRVTRHVPVLITMRLVDGLPSLRQMELLDSLHACFAKASESDGFAVVEFSIQSNHLHLIVEADSTKNLSRGMQGLGVRIAKRLNRVWQRRGSVFADRFHSRPLRTPSEVRRALLYVLHNKHKHGGMDSEIDPFSSALWFEGWRSPRPSSPIVRPTPTATCWLLTRGWRKAAAGLLRIEERPISAQSTRQSPTSNRRHQRRPAAHPRQVA